MVRIQICADFVFPNRSVEREQYERNKANTVAAIEHARKLDDEAFANISRPQLGRNQNSGQRQNQCGLDAATHVRTLR